MLAQGCGPSPSATPAASPPVARPAAVKPAPSLDIASLPNLRDVGGHATGDGRTVCGGLLYRSGQLYGIPPTDMERLAKLGLTCDYDLRLDAERASRPDQVPAGAQLVALDVLADADETSLRRIDEILRNPRRITATPGGNTADAAAAIVLIYREFVTLPSAKKAYGGLFTRLAEEGGTPAVLHCTSGKDRSGWAAAALLTLLGVPKEAVMADFLRSNDVTLPQYKKQAEGFVAAGGEAGVFPAVVGVRAEYLEASLDEVQKRYGSIEKYFAEGLGIDAAGQAKLRAKFLQP
jgi:protein-tyrosine phosphatase